MVQKEIYITNEGHENLDNELNYLKTVRRKEVAVRIYKATDAGGAVDNAEYDAAKNEQAFVEGRVSELEDILSKAVVALIDRSLKDAVQLGSSVTVALEDGSAQVYIVVGSVEAAPLEGKISIESPAGRALLGQKVGDKVDVETPSGFLQLTILRVR